VIKNIQFIDVTDRVQQVNGVSFLQVDDRIYMLSEMEKLPDGPKKVQPKKKSDVSFMSPFDDKDSVKSVRGKVGSLQKTHDALALGEKIKARREALNLDIAEFAELGSCSHSQVHAWQSGRFCQITETMKAALKAWKVKAPPKKSCLWHHPKSAAWAERRSVLTM